MRETQSVANHFAPTQTLNEIIAQTPEALPVLQSFGLDTCCGGALPLEEAVRRHNLYLETVLAALHGVQPGATK